MAHLSLTEERGPQLADYLANNLSNLEFELLIRARIKLEIARAYEFDDSLADSHTEVSFNYSVTDQSKWKISLGETYSQYSNSVGEVLSVTINDTLDMQRAKKRNKLSLLLVGPKFTSDIPF